MTTTATRSDWDLVTASQHGDRDAFGELWRLYQPSVHRYVHRRVRDRGVAEDLTSDTFLRAWMSIGTVRDRGTDFEAWLITIARNKVIDYSRSAARRHEVVALIGVDDHRDGDDRPGPDTTVPEQLSRAGVADHIGQYVALLPDHQQHALRMRYVDELPFAVIATTLACNQGAVRSGTTRARYTLRQLLEASGFTSSAAFAAAAPDTGRRAG